VVRGHSITGRDILTSRYNFALTKVQIRFRLEDALNDKLFESISDAQAIYGIERIQLNLEITQVLVEYDATRLRPQEVEAALRGRGISVAKEQ